MLVNAMLLTCSLLAAAASAEPPVPSAPQAEAPSAPRAEATGPAIIFDETLDLRSFERLVAVGARRYYIVYQDDCDPGAKSTGKIDIALLSRCVAEQAGKFPSQWGVLDFETPFDDWIKEGPESERCRIAVDSMVAALEKLRALFPDIKWAYYGVPRLEFYMDGKTWVTAPDEVKRQAIEAQFARYAPIIAKSDWLCPSVYMVVGDRGDGGRPGPDQRKATRAWTEALVRASVDFGGRVGNRVPVIPFVSPAYQPGGGARIRGLIPAPIIEECTLRPILDAGGDGICLWTAGAYFIAQATGAPQPGKDPDPEAIAALKNWSEDFHESEAFLRSPDGVASLRNRFSEATAAMAEQFAKAWGIRRTAAQAPMAGAAPKGDAGSSAPR